MHNDASMQHSRLDQGGENASYLDSERIKYHMYHLRLLLALRDTEVLLTLPCCFVHLRKEGVNDDSQYRIGKEMCAHRLVNRADHFDGTPSSWIVCSQTK